MTITVRQVTAGLERPAQKLLSLGFALTGRRRCFVAYWRQGRNFGDDYLASALRRYLKQTFPRMRVILTGLELDNQAPNPNDIIIIAGGGLWGPSGTQEIDHHLFAVWMGWKGRLVIANLGIESFGGQSAPQLKALWEKTALFSVRDRLSLEYAEQVLGQKTVIWAADTTYLSPLRIPRAPVRGCIGVNLCGSEVENHFRNYSLGPLIEALIALKNEGHTLCAAAFSHDPAHSDYPHCRQVDPDCSPRFSQEPYRHCEVFIGMRFHSVLLALQNSIPVIAINYSGKVRRLMQEYGLEDYCLEPEEPDLQRKLRQLLGEPCEAVLEKIRVGNQNVEQRLSAFKEKLTRLLQDDGNGK